MAEFWAYVPEPDEMSVLLGGAVDEERDRREERLIVGFLELQAYCNRNKDLERYLTLAEVRQILREEWLLAALSRALPARPPLLHVPGGPGTLCPFEGCLDRCYDESCTCSVGAWRPSTDYRLCLMR